MVRLQNFVCVCNDPEFELLQQIARIHPGMYLVNPELFREFGQLSGIIFTFI